MHLSFAMCKSYTTMRKRIASAPNSLIPQNSHAAATIFYWVLNASACAERQERGWDHLGRAACTLCHLLCTASLNAQLLDTHLGGGPLGLQLKQLLLSRLQLPLQPAMQPWCHHQPSCNRLPLDWSCQLQAISCRHTITTNSSSSRLI